MRMTERESVQYFKYTLQTTSAKEWYRSVRDLDSWEQVKLSFIDAMMGKHYEQIWTFSGLGFDRMIRSW